jgi:hypothetical protein
LSSDFFACLFFCNFCKHPLLMVFFQPRYLSKEYLPLYFIGSFLNALLLYALKLSSVSVKSINIISPLPIIVVIPNFISLFRHF